MKLLTMKKRFLITLFFCVVGLSISAQTTIQSIRKAYGEVKEHIARMTPDVVISQAEVYELHLWFDGKRLLRFNARTNGEESFTGADIPPLFRDEVSRLKQRAQKLKVLFKGIDDNTYL